MVLRNKMGLLFIMLYIYEARVVHREDLDLDFVLEGLKAFGLGGTIQMEATVLKMTITAPERLDRKKIRSIKGIVSCQLKKSLPDFDLTVKSLQFVGTKSEFKSPE